LFELPDVELPNVSHGCHYTHKDETLFKHTTHTLGYSLNYESIKPAPCRQHTHSFTHYCIEQAVTTSSCNFMCILHEDCLHMYFTHNTFYAYYVLMHKTRPMQIWHLCIHTICLCWDI